MNRIPLVEVVEVVTVHLILDTVKAWMNYLNLQETVGCVTTYKEKTSTFGMFCDKDSTFNINTYLLFCYNTMTVIGE